MTGPKAYGAKFSIVNARGVNFIQEKWRPYHLPYSRQSRVKIWGIERAGFFQIFSDFFKIRLLSFELPILWLW